jgi:hypothetical protein
MESLCDVLLGSAGATEQALAKAVIFGQMIRAFELFLAMARSFSQDDGLTMQKISIYMEM